MRARFTFVAYTVRNSCTSGEKSQRISKCSMNLNGTAVHVAAVALIINLFVSIITTRSLSKS